MNVFAKYRPNVCKQCVLKLFTSLLMLFALSLQVSAIGPDQLANLKKPSVIVFYVEQSEKC